MPPQDQIVLGRAEDIALFVHEVPGYQVMENGVLLPEASEDQR